MGVGAAFQSLAHIQLVEIQRNKGAFVASPTLRKVREVVDACALLEPFTARPAAEAAWRDGLCFDHLPFCQDCLTAPEVEIGGGQVA